MINNPLVSIMMPVYNGMPMVQASIESLLNQTYTNWECIIVDDGSTDNTYEFLMSLKDNRFHVIHFSENKGRPVARQTCLNESNGEFVSMLDADDLWHPKKLEKQLQVFQTYPDLALVSTNMCSFGINSDCVHKRKGCFDAIENFTNENVPIHASSMMKTKEAKKYSYNPLMKLGQDRDFLRKYLKGQKFMQMSDILYYYSEFDSVTKLKIRKTYKLTCLDYLQLHSYRWAFIYFLKYIYSYIVFPFKDINDIIKVRGESLTSEEYNDYLINCKLIVDKYCKK